MIEWNDFCLTLTMNEHVNDHKPQNNYSTDFDYGGVGVWLSQEFSQLKKIFFLWIILLCHSFILFFYVQ